MTACLADYPQRWPSFFDDLLATLRLGARCVDLYLRILRTIDSEVVDRDIVHSAQVRVAHGLAQGCRAQRQCCWCTQYNVSCQFQ